MSKMENEKFEQLKNNMIDLMNIDKSLMHLMSMSIYLKSVSVKEFFEILECEINRVNRNE